TDDGASQAGSEAGSALSVSAPPTLAADRQRLGIGSGARLSQAELVWITQAAIERWKEAGVAAEDLARLQQVTFETGRLPGGQLVSITGTPVTFDDTGAGYGWFVDRTPFDDSEFDVPVPNRELHTTELSPAFGRVDLLTAVMRELGYVYMQGKGRVPRRLRPLMEEVLSPSMRRLPDSSSIHMIQPHTDAGPGPQAVSTGPAVSARVRGSAPSRGGMGLKSGLTPQSGETINQNLGTLPQGKSITMMFQVTINNSVPAGTQEVCNQGTISGSNFTTVVTDDPSTG